MNTTTIDALAYLTAVPLNLLRTTASAMPTYSFVQVPHIKLKAEHQALVLFHIIKIGLAYWEGWHDSKKNSKEKKDKDDTLDEGRDEARIKRSKRRKKAKRQNGVVQRGKYTIVFQ